VTVGLFARGDSEIDQLVKDRATGIVVVGFGYIGTVIGAVLADCGWQVTGIDVRQDVVDQINAGGPTHVREPHLDELVAANVSAGRLRATTDFSAVRDNDIVIVTVGTPLGSDFDPIVDDIEAAAKGVAQHLHRGHLVILKSTVPPNTTEGLVLPILEASGLRAGADFGLAFCPERLAEGRAIAEFTQIPVVVGAHDAHSAAACRSLWQHGLGVESVVVDGPAAAEMTKLADNLWIDLNIALANELAQVCDGLGIDALDVINAANTLPKVDYNVNILRPSVGVGGYCLTKDPWFVQHLGESLGLTLLTPRTSRTVNEAMPTYTFGLVKSLLESQGKALERCRVAVLGISFKTDTGDCRLTPTKYTIEHLEASGCELTVHDPWVTEQEAATVTSVPLTDDMATAVEGADALVFLTGHRQFHDVALSRLWALTADPCVFLDGRNSFSPADVRAAGFTYKGIGR
jgi:UDP-N-acetyl-D-mannosaminuronic acid dehydrogenase